jgi:hypothetical protein
MRLLPKGRKRFPEKNESQSSHPVARENSVTGRFLRIRESADRFVHLHAGDPGGALMKAYHS